MIFSRKFKYSNQYLDLLEIFSKMIHSMFRISLHGLSQLKGSIEALKGE